MNAEMFLLEKEKKKNSYLNTVGEDQGELG